MHPNNRHFNGYDFISLAKEFEDLTPYLYDNEYGKRSLDFSKQECIRLFNKVLLKKYYGIDHWDIPPDNLCPAVPGRADYLHYLRDILGDASKRILDIGTGAGAIYPILGLQLFGWSFVGTDIDQASLTHAHGILEKLSIGTDKIKLRLQRNQNKIFDHVLHAHDRFDACICNPPFFETALHAQRWNQRKWKLENGHHIGTSNELVYEGGEKGFIKKMIKESVLFQKHIAQFSCLVSRRSTIDLIEQQCKEVAVTSLEFIQMKTGRKLSRIAIWSY